ncbi:hypothetical protein [Arsenicibacter rosenii]|uniref:Uncharacterized protein n=1 Tax=Arsenicibacter rosenii TaxID=1750698 RepID=A0A1S2VJY3_9BACT|nr:hypothetical protein [Arsenicibacter rosenii]OIN59097.1 hypothetical protein BLX24_12900 [Arsenicibacter rosenii]
MSRPQIYANPTPKQHQFQLTSAIFGVMAVYGRNPKFLFTGDQPQHEGSYLKWLEQNPAIGIIAEVAGTTITIEVTDQRSGEVEVPDALHFYCYDFETFRAWFSAKLNSLKANKKTLAKRPVIRPSITRFPRKK